MCGLTGRLSFYLAETTLCYVTDTLRLKDKLCCLHEYILEFFNLYYIQSVPTTQLERCPLLQMVIHKLKEQHIGYIAVKLLLFFKLTSRLLTRDTSYPFSFYNMLLLLEQDDEVTSPLGLEYSRTCDKSFDYVYNLLTKNSVDQDPPDA